MESDLFDIQQTFNPSMQASSTGLPVATAWAGRRNSHHHRTTLLSSIFYHVLFFVLSLSSCCVWLWCPPVLLFCISSFFLSSACLDPFTSAEAGDDSMPNLNPFLSKVVVDAAAHLPVVSSDGVSYSSRTSGHEMFGGKDTLCSSWNTLHVSLCWTVWRKSPISRTVVTSVYM